MNLRKCVTERNAPCRLVRALTTWWEAVGDRLHLQGDAEALRYGWEISRRPFSLTHRYRDPRFDGLLACPVCGGLGAEPTGSICSRCLGSGRIHAQNGSSPAEGLLS